MNRIRVLVCVWGLICLTIFTARLRGQQDSVPDPVEPVNTAEEFKPRRSPGANDGADPQLQLKRRVRPNAPRIAPPNAVRSRPVLVTRTVNEVIHQEIPAEELKEAEQLRSAIKALKEVKEDDSVQKEKLMKDIQVLLAKQFERDLKQREAALVPLEDRVKSLRKQLDKRKSAMDEIVNLRFKTITNEIDGLSFPGEDNSTELPSDWNIPVKPPIRNAPVPIPEDDRNPNT